MDMTPVTLTGGWRFLFQTKPHSTLRTRNPIVRRMRGINAMTGKALDGIAHLRQSIRDILTTPLGSRVMRRNYGSRLFDLIDNPINDQTLVEIFAATADALIKWEPRLKVTRVQARSVTGDAIPTPKPYATGNLIIRDWNAYERTYTVNGVTNGRPRYEHSEGTIVWVTIPGFLPGTIGDQYWEINIPGEDPLGSPSTSVVIRSRSNVATPDLAADWYLAVNDLQAPKFSVRAEIVTPAAPSPSTSHVVIDLEAIYLPTGQPVFLDGLVIK